MRRWGGRAAAAVATGLFFGLLTPRSAMAGEGIFQRTYTTDTVPAGHFELEQLVRDRSGRAYGSYNAQDFSTEIEYGVTDDLQAAFYLNSGHVDAKGAPDDDDPNGVAGFTRNKWYVENVSAEFIYRLVSPYKNKHHIGVAVYLEPEYAFTDRHNALPYDHTFALEGKMIVQKNWLDDRLIAAANLGFEMESVHFKGDLETNSELDWDNTLGLSYRFAPNWSAGIEGRNHNEYGNFTVHEHSVFWVGPTLHYGGEKFWATLGLLEQIYGTPNGVDKDSGAFLGDNLFLRSHERHEITFKIGKPF